MLKSTKATALTIIIVLGLAALSWGVFAFLNANSTEEAQVVVIDGDGVEHVYDLYEDGEYTIETSLGTNTFSISDGVVVMIDADCPNHDCMYQSALSEGSVGSIVCLPNELVVKVTGSSDNDLGIDAI